MRVVELAREFINLVRSKLGSHYVKIYLLYLRVLSVLMELGEVKITDLLNMLEENLRDKTLLSYLVSDLAKLGLVTQRGETIYFNYGRYLELRGSIARSRVELGNLQVLGPLLTLFREYVMRRGLPEK